MDYTEIHARYKSFGANPVEQRLRGLLNVKTDGATFYLHMALLGKAFAEHPDRFEQITNDLRTDREWKGFRWLADHGDAVFEYYPEYKATNFDDVYRGATWLQKQRTKGDTSPQD